MVLRDVCVDDVVPIFVKTVLTVLLSAGVPVTAATATRPAASAYSTRSSPRVSFQTRFVST